MSRKPARPKTPRVAEPAATYETTPEQTRTARLFRNGRSQAVRLPREFRFEGDAVAIRREGGRVILEPLGATKRGWPRGYWERVRELTRDFTFPGVEPIGGKLLEVDLDEPA